MAAEGGHPLAVELLPEEAARQLLTRRMGAARVASDPSAIDAIITGGARLPLSFLFLFSFFLPFLSFLLFLLSVFFLFFFLFLFFNAMILQSLVTVKRCFFRLDRSAVRE